jgi:hypothetical protein
MRSYLLHLFNCHSRWDDAKSEKRFIIALNPSPMWIPPTGAGRGIRAYDVNPLSACSLTLEECLTAALDCADPIGNRPLPELEYVACSTFCEPLLAIAWISGLSATVADTSVQYPLTWLCRNTAPLPNSFRCEGHAKGFTCLRLYVSIIRTCISIQKGGRKWQRKR